MERAWLERIVFETGCAERHSDTVFLCDPHWSAAQREQFKEIVEAARCAPTSHAKRHATAAIVAAELGTAAMADECKSPCWCGWLAIPTGGSSGGLKFALHDERTLGAAVRGFCAHFGVSRVNAVDCLPPWHVSGLMARLRCAVRGGVHLPWEWKRLEAGDFPELPDRVRKDGVAASLASGWFLSLVPTQLQRLLKQGERAGDWLRGFRAVFVGGGPLWSSLADEAAAARLPIVLSYGMTETGAMVAAQRWGDFAAGDRSSGVPMPHAQISINAEGLVCVCGESVMNAYWGHALCHGVFTTADFGIFDEAGRLHILGRRDEVAISGGEKVRLSEVEAVLRGAKSVDGRAFFDDVAVVAVPDPEWGEAVVACYLSAGASALSDAVIEADPRALARHQRPKLWLAFAPEDWPRNAQGKLNRTALREAVCARMGTPGCAE